METGETQRLIIRRFREEDLSDFLSYQGHPDVLVYMGAAPMSEEQGARFIAKQKALQDGERGAYHAFAVYHRGDEKVIGDVGFFLQKEPDNSGDLGFQLHPAYHRQGYGREAAQALIRYGFLELELDRITSGCDARNVASFRLMESLGFKREAHLKQSQTTGGVVHDQYTYALLRSEWTP